MKIEIIERYQYMWICPKCKKIQKRCFITNVGSLECLACGTIVSQWGNMAPTMLDWYEVDSNFDVVEKEK